MDALSGYLVFFGLIAGLVWLIRWAVRERRAVRDYAHQIDGFEPNHVVTHSLSNSFAIDSKHGQIVILEGGKGSRSHRLYQGADILACEVVVNSMTVTKTSRGSQLGGAAVGGALFGKRGAMVGGMTGKTRSSERTTSVKVKISLDDPDHPVEEISTGEAEADKVHSLIAAIIRRADNERAAAAQAHATSPQLDVVDQIKRLAALRNEGVLTVEEFQAKKTALLAQIG